MADFHGNEVLCLEQSQAFSGSIPYPSLGENVCRVRKSFNALTLVVTKIQSMLSEIVMCGTVPFRSWSCVSVAGGYGCHGASSKHL